MTMRGARGGILVRFELADGTTKWRNLPNLEHSTLCKAGGLDPCATWYDTSSGFSAGGGVGRGRRVVDGFIFQGPKGSPPIGKLTICQPDEKFKDEDPIAYWRSLGVPVHEPMSSAWRETG